MNLLPDLDNDSVVGCALGALIGDVIGSQSEFMEPDQIAARFGWIDSFEPDPGSDDTIMSRFLCDALIRTDGMATSDDWASAWLRGKETQIVPHRNRFFPSVLYIAEKLERGYLPREVSAGSMPSTSSAMAIWPVGVVNFGRPLLAASHAEELGSLIHSRDLGFCQDAAAAIAACVSIAVTSTATFEDIVPIALGALKPVSGREMRQVISAALDLACETDDYEAFRDSYHATFRRTIFCDARETVPAAFALCLLAKGNFGRAVEYAANFGRDTDTIACMVGALSGAINGVQAIPEQWLSSLGADAVDDAREIAEALGEAAHQRLATVSGR